MPRRGQLGLTEHPRQVPEPAHQGLRRLDPRPRHRPGGRHPRRPVHRPHRHPRHDLLGRQPHPRHLARPTRAQSPTDPLRRLPSLRRTCRLERPPRPRRVRHADPRRHQQTRQSNRRDRRRSTLITTMPGALNERPVLSRYHVQRPTQSSVADYRHPSVRRPGRYRPISGVGNGVSSM